MICSILAGWRLVRWHVLLDDRPHLIGGSLCDGRHVTVMLTHLARLQKKPQRACGAPGGDQLQHGTEQHPVLEAAQTQRAFSLRLVNQRSAQRNNKNIPQDQRAMDRGIPNRQIASRLASRLSKTRDRNTS
jgi:hypothetical protein